MDDEIEFLSADDKASLAYGLCVGGWIAVGMSVTSTVGSPLAGALGGAAWGKATCPALIRKFVPRIKTTSMSEREFQDMMRDFKNEYPGKGRKELLAIAGMFATEIKRGRYDETGGSSNSSTIA